MAMLEPRLPDCVGSPCERHEFAVSAVKLTSFTYKNPLTGKTEPQVITDDAREAFKKAVEALYEMPLSKGCGNDCVCEKTDKELKKTVASQKEHTHVFPGGAKAEGTYKLSVTVYEGV